MKNSRIKRHANVYVVQMHGMSIPTDNFLGICLSIRPLIMFLNSFFHGFLLVFRVGSFEGEKDFKK